MSQYAVLLKDPAAELLAPAAFLAGTKGHTRDSALLFLRSNPGFLCRFSPLEAARELAAAAGQAGFGTALVPETELPALPPPLYADKIEPKGDGFYATAAGAVNFIPYESITVMSAAAYDAPALPRSAEDLKPGLFARLAALAGAPQPPQPAPARETFFRADVIGGEGPLRLVLAPEALDFSPLGAARSPSSLVNFRALLDAVSSPAFKAVKNAALGAFLASLPLAAHKVSSPEAADLELARLLLLASSREP